MMKEIKMYSVIFREHTNYARDCVTNLNPRPETETGVHKEVYLKADHEFLVREDELEGYRKFGGGFALVKFAGWTYEKSLDDIVKWKKDLSEEGPF